MNVSTRTSLNTVVLSALIAFPLLSPSQAFAASDDECAIWMCLPTGFITGCSGAKKAFLKRIKHFKPPLPSFASCMVQSPASMPSQDTYTSDYGTAAYIPPLRQCTRKENTFKDTYECVEWETIPEQYIKNRRCHIDNKNGIHTPRHCTKTYRYTEVYRNGQLFGETHYY